MRTPTTAASPRRSTPVRTALGAAVLLAVLAVLNACAAPSPATVTDPTVAALTADPMGTWKPDHFSPTVVKSARPAKRASATNAKPTSATWTRAFTSTSASAPATKTLEDLTEAAEAAGWHIDYAGPADVAASKTIDGAPAVLYASISDPATSVIKKTDAYLLHISLQS